MRNQIAVAALAFLLVVVFLAAWFFALPAASPMPFPSRAKPEPTPTIQPTVVIPTATPIPTPTRTPVPTPEPTPTPAPTRTPIPTPTPLPTPTPTPPPATPTPASYFLRIEQPADRSAVYTYPRVTVSGATLPRSIVEFTYSGGGRDERRLIVQAGGDGAFSAIVPLVEGANVIEIIGYHGASERQAREFRLVTYIPASAPLELTVVEPRNGAVVTEPVVKILGTTAPDARVALNDLIPARPDDLGRWEASILLQPDSNPVRIVATRGDERVELTLTITYRPGP